MDKEQFNQHLTRDKSNASNRTNEDVEKSGITNLPPQLNIKATEAKEEPKEEKAEEQTEKKGTEEKERFTLGKETAGDDGQGDNDGTNSGDGGNANNAAYQPNKNQNGKDKKADNADKFLIKENAKQQKENIEKPLYEIGGGGNGADSGADAGAENPGTGIGGSGSAPNGLPNEVNNKMQTAFNADFSDVNIIKDSQESKDIGAFAFTQGSDVHFAPGKFQPFTPKGQELIGHELAHVVQQDEGKVEETTKTGNRSINDNPALEKEADVKGKKAAQTKPTKEKKEGKKGEKAPKGKAKPKQKKKPTPKKAVAQTKLPPGKQFPTSKVPTSKLPTKDTVPIAPDTESIIPEFVLVGDILNIEYDILEQNGYISLDLDLHNIATVVKAEVTIEEGNFASGKLFIKSDHLPGVQFELLINSDGTVDPTLVVDSQTRFKGMAVGISAIVTNESIEGSVSVTIDSDMPISDSLTATGGSVSLNLGPGGNFMGNIIVETNDGYAKGEASVSYDIQNEIWAGGASIETQSDKSIELPPSATLVIPIGAVMSLSFGPDGTIITGSMGAELTVGLQTTDGIQLNNLNVLYLQLGINSSGITVTGANFNSETTAFGLNGTVQANYSEDTGFTGTLSLAITEPKDITPQLSATSGSLVYNFTPDNDTFTGQLTVNTQDGFLQGDANVDYDQMTDTWSGLVTMTSISTKVIDINERTFITLPIGMLVELSFGPDGTTITGDLDAEIAIDLNVDSMDLTGLALLGLELGFDETGITLISMDIDSETTLGNLNARVDATINEEGIAGIIEVDVVDNIEIGEGLEVVSGNLTYVFGPEPDSFDGSILIQTVDGWAQGTAEVTLDPITSEWSGSAVLSTLEDNEFPIGASGSKIVLPAGIEFNVSFGPDGTEFNAEVTANIFVDIKTDEGVDLTDLSIFTIVLGIDNSGITILSCQIESVVHVYGFDGYVSALIDEEGIIGSVTITLAESKPLGDSLTATSGEIIYNFGPEPDEFEGVLVIETNDGFFRGEAEVYLDPVTSEWTGTTTLTSETAKVIPVGGDTNIILPDDIEVTVSFGPDGTVIDGIVGAQLEVGINATAGGIDITGVSTTEIELGIDNSGITIELLTLYTSVDLLGMNAEINAEITDGQISGTVAVVIIEPVPLGDKLMAVSGSLDYVFGPEPDALNGDIIVQTNDQIAQGEATVTLDPATSLWSGTARLSLIDNKVIPLGSGAQIVLPKDMYIDMAFGPEGTTVVGEIGAELTIDLNVEEGLDLEGVAIADVMFTVDETGISFVSLQIDTIVDVEGMLAELYATVTPDAITGIISITLTEEKDLPGNLVATGGMLEYDFTTGGSLTGDITVKTKEDFATGTAIVYYDLITKDWSGVATLLTTQDKVVPVTEGVDITIPAGMEITIGFSPEGANIDGSATLQLDVDTLIDGIELTGIAEVVVSLTNDGIKVDSFHLLTTTTVLGVEAQIDLLIEDGVVSGMFTIELTEDKPIGGYIIVTSGTLQFAFGTGNAGQFEGEVSVQTTDGFAEGVATVSIDRETEEWSGTASLFSLDDKHFILGEGITLTLPAGISVEVEFGPDSFEIDIEGSAAVEVILTTDGGLQAGGVASLDLGYNEEQGLFLSPNTIMLAVTAGLTTPDMDAIMTEGTLSTDVDAGAFLTLTFDGTKVSKAELEATGSFSNEERRLGRISFSGTMNMRPLSLNGMMHAVTQADLTLLAGEKYSTVLIPGSQFFMSIDEQGVSNIDASLGVEWRKEEEAIASLTLIGMLPRGEALSMEGTLELLQELIIKEPSDESLGFSILKGASVGVTVEEGKVTGLSGSIGMYVSDMEGPLFAGEFAGEIGISEPDQNLTIESGAASLTLMDDYVMEFDGGDVTILGQAGVGASFAEGKLQTIGGLVAAAYSDGESTYEISAQLEYDVVNKSILYLDADISTDKVFSLFDGQLEISELSGGLSIRNDQVVQVGGHAKLEAELGDMYLVGEADVAWIRDEDGESAFIGSGYLEFSWFDGEDNPDRFVTGVVEASVNRDEFDLYGEVEVGIMKGLTGAASVRMDEEMDPVISASLTYSATVMEGDELWAEEFGFEITIPVIGIVSIEAGILFGASIDTLPLILFGTAGISNWRPKSGEMPDFEAQLAATWGINISAKIMAYVGVLIGIPVVLNASAGIRAGLGIDVPITLNPYVSLFGNKDGVGGELGVNLSIAPILKLLIEAYVKYEVLGIWDGEKIWELYQQELGNLGEINWEGSFAFGDEEAIPSGGGGGQAPAQVEAPTASKIATPEDTNKDTDLGYGKNDGPESDEEGGIGGLMDGFEGPSEDTGDQTETGGLGSKLSKIGVYADGLSAVAELIKIIKDGISAFIKGSIVGFILWWIFRKPDKARVDELKAQINVFKVTLIDEGFLSGDSMITNVLNVLDGSYSIFSAIFDNNAPFKLMVEMDYHKQATIDERAEICRELLDGPTGNGAEQALYEVARHTKQAEGKTALRELISKSYGLNKWNSDFHGKEQRWLNDLLDNVYGSDYNYNSSAKYTAEPGAYIVKEGRNWAELAATAFGDASYEIYIRAHGPNSNPNSPYAHIPTTAEVKTIALSTIGERFTLGTDHVYTHRHETFDWIAANVYGNPDYADKLQALNPFVVPTTVSLMGMTFTIMPEGKTITLPTAGELGNPWIEVSPTPIGTSTYTIWVESESVGSVPVMYAGPPNESVKDIANIAKQTEEGKSAGDALFTLANFSTETTQLDANNAVENAAGLLDFLLVAELFAFEVVAGETTNDGSVPIGSAQPGDIVNPNGTPLSEIGEIVYSHKERGVWISEFGPNEGYADPDSENGDAVEQQYDVAQAEGLARTATTNDTSVGISQNVSTKSEAKQSWLGGLFGGGKKGNTSPPPTSEPTVPSGMVLLPTWSEMFEMDALPVETRGVAPKSTIEAKGNDTWAGLASLAYDDWSLGLALIDYSENKGASLSDGNEITIPTIDQLNGNSGNGVTTNGTSTTATYTSVDGENETTDQESTETRVLEPGNKVKIIEGDTWSHFAREAYDDFTVFVKLANHPDNSNVKTLPVGGIVTLPTLENLDGIPEFGLGLSLNGFPLLTEMVNIPTEDDGSHHVWVEDRGDEYMEDPVWMMASDPFELEPEVDELVQDTILHPTLHPHALSIQSMVHGEQTTAAIDNTRVDIKVMVEAQFLASENENTGGETTGGETTGGETTTEPFEETIPRADLASNANSLAHNRWVDDGMLSKYGNKFFDIIDEHIKVIFGEDITAKEVLTRIAAAEVEGRDADVQEMNAKLFAANQYAVLEVLDVENNDKYQPGGGKTYCNVYAYDVVTALGGYLPRVWWKEAALAKIKNGETVKPVYGKTVYEMNANAITKWMAEYGDDFGWKKETDIAQAQAEANNGKIAILLAANKNAKRSGHVSVILSETEQHKANGDMPLASQAGASNYEHQAVTSKWWENSSHKDGAAWIYEGKIDSPIMTPDQVGGNMGTQTTTTTTDTDTGTDTTNDTFEVKPPYSIKQSVGKNGFNDINDTKVVQTLLALHSCYQGEIHGICDDYTIQVIEDFQLDTFGWADGTVNVGQDTWTALINLTNQNEGETETPTGTEAGVSEEVTDDVVDHLKLREGFRQDVYPDPVKENKPTAGYGHLLSKAERLTYPIGAIVPMNVIDQWLADDSSSAYANAVQKAITIGYEAQILVNALTAVNYQLGNAWQTIHKKTWAHLEDQNWVQAATEAADSKWFEQTPVRVFDFQRALLTIAGRPTDFDSMVAFNLDMIESRGVNMPNEDYVMAFNPLEITDTETDTGTETANNSTDTETGDNTFSSTIEELTGSVGAGGANDLYDVMLIQELLHKAGYDSGPIDGLIGSITIGAIRNFQQVNLEGDPSGLIEKESPSWNQLIIIASGEEVQEGVPPGGTRVDKNGLVFSEHANMRSEPDTTADNITATLGYNDPVYVIKEFPGGWYYVDCDCGAGYVAAHFIKTNLPDPESSLYQVAAYPKCYTDIYNHYKDQGYAPTTGFDDRHILMAVYLANKSNPGVSLDMDKFNESQGSTVNWFDNQDDNRAVFQSIQLQEGFSIWLPSMSYVNILVKSGDIATRPDWVDSGIAVGKGIVGFTDGLLTGFFGGIWNTITGLFDIGKELLGVIGKVITGAIKEDLEAMFEFIQNLDAAKGKEILDSLIQGAKDGFTNFNNGWNSPNHYEKWEFRGKVVGNVILEVVLAIFTGGLGNAAKWLAKLEKISKPLFNILKRIGKKVEDVIPDKIKNKDGDTDLGDTPFEKQQAIMMAKTVTEAHDAKNSSIPVLRASLALVERKYKKHITKFDIDEKAGMPGHYTVKMVGSKHNIDNDYTPGNGVIPRNWKNFDEQHNEEFIKKLGEFRGDNVLTRNTSISGGEGQLFKSPKESGKALKRWFKHRIEDMPKSIKLLEDAKVTIKGNPALDKDMDIVNVYEKGTDWVRRDFAEKSRPLKDALKDPEVSAARDRLLNELAGKTDEMSKNLSKKLKKPNGKPSANAHWCPKLGKILIIDMM